MTDSVSAVAAADAALSSRANREAAEPTDSRRAEFDQLVASNRLLRDAIVDITKLLRESSRHVCYCPRTDVNATGPADDAAEPPGGDVVSSEIPNDDIVGQGLVDELVFAQADAEARERYRSLKDEFGLTRQWSEDARMSSTHGRQPFYSSAPKWHNSSPGPPVRGVEPTSEQRESATWLEEMTMALFDFDRNKFDLPFEELMLSYSQYLPVGWAGLEIGHFWHQRELCVDIGRFFQEMLLQKNIGRPAWRRLSWSSHFRASQQFTLQKLLQWCRPRSRDTFGDGPQTDDNILWLHIYEVLCDTNHVSALDTQTVVYDKLSLDSTVQDVLESKYSIPRGFYLPKDTTPYIAAKYFAPSDVCFKRITKVGGLKLQWTHFYREHLQLNESSQTLSVFWDIGVIQQSGLFWLPPHDHDAFDLRVSVHFHRQNGATDDIHEELNLGYVTELAMTYRLIFCSAKTELLPPASLEASDQLGILYDDQFANEPELRTRLDVNRPEARRALKNYLSMPIPSEHTELRTSAPTHDYSACPKLSAVLQRGPPFPLDMAKHMDALLAPLARPGYALRAEEPYADYPTFATRLRELKGYLDAQKPRSLGQAWRDRRDTVGYFTFWSVIFVGVATIVLALISIAISTAQTVVAFQALNPAP